VEVFEMVPVMIFSRERLLGTSAFMVVAGESVFLVCTYMYILVMAFEVGWPAEDILFGAWGGVLTRIPVFFSTSYEEVRIERIYIG
jgi:hypothetical protein